VVAAAVEGASRLLAVTRITVGVACSAL